jgi:hypothetical protein
MFPAFAGSIGSYHAFSIHVATLHEQPDEQTEGTREQHEFQEHESAPRAEPVEHRTVGDSLPQHIDVCEISMNICFKGSAVKLTQLNGAKAAIPAASLFGSPVLARHIKHIYLPQPQPRRALAARSRSHWGFFRGSTREGRIGRLLVCII